MGKFSEKFLNAFSLKDDDEDLDEEYDYDKEEEDIPTRQKSLKRKKNLQQKAVVSLTGQESLHPILQLLTDQNHVLQLILVEIRKSAFSNRHQLKMAVR